MKTRLIFTVIATLALAACTTGTPSPAASPSPPDSPSPPASPSPAASPSAGTVDVVVTFDGTTCAYEGPKVVPDGTVMHWTYTPTEEVADTSAFIVAPVDAGMPADVIAQGPKSAADPPDWYYAGYSTSIVGPGTAVTTAVADRVPEQIGYMVGCFTFPEAGGLHYPAFVLEVSPAP